MVVITPEIAVELRRRNTKIEGWKLCDRIIHGNWPQ